MAGKRLVLALAFFMVALMAAVPSTAFKVTSIINQSPLTVSASDVAGLAVAATSSSNSVNQVTYQNGQVQVHFGKGNGGTIYSLMNSRTDSGFTVAADFIKMLNVLTVTNNSKYCQDVAVWVSSGTATNLTEIYGRPPNGALDGTRLNTPTRLMKLQSGGQMVVDFHWRASNAIATSGNFTLSIKGTKSATCP